MALHVYLVWSRDGVWGGADLVPHLHVIAALRDGVALHTTYAPGYHLFGALLTPWLGVEGYTKGFAIVAALALIAGFRSFQRAAQLPDAASALFACTPYLLALSACTPKVEAFGYGLLLFGLGFLWRRRYAAAALVLAACFYFHTASALLYGLAGGVLCLARRDSRGMMALACGSLGALPLVAAHVSAGCSLAESLMLARGGFSPAARTGVIPPNWAWLVPLANPVTLVAAVLGARMLWSRERALALLCGAFVFLYFNNVWLAPFEIRTLVTLLRGLTMLAIPIAVCAGVFAAHSQRGALAWVGAAALWAVVSVPMAVPKACFVRPITAEEIAGTSIDRCVFVWRGPLTPRQQP